MMARSPTRSNQRPDTLMQDRLPPTRRKPLATHGRTIHLAKSEKTAEKDGAGKRSGPSGRASQRRRSYRLHPRLRAIPIKAASGLSTRTSHDEADRPQHFEIVLALEAYGLGSALAGARIPSLAVRVGGIGKGHLEHEVLRQLDPEAGQVALERSTHALADQALGQRRWNADG